MLNHVLNLFHDRFSISFFSLIPSLEKGGQFRGSKELVGAYKWQRNALIGVTQVVKPNQGGFFFLFFSVISRLPRSRGNLVFYSSLYKREVMRDFSFPFKSP
jgi:hypothetical protein